MTNEEQIIEQRVSEILNNCTYPIQCKFLRAETIIVGSQRSITAYPGDNIQSKINALNDMGGGTLKFSAGTYILPTLTSYTDISFEGDVMSDTILDFNNVGAGFSISGTNVYTTGTITSISGGVNVTGSGTAWLANASEGQHIFLGTRWYLIAAVTSDTTLILAEGYVDDLTMPGLAYRIADPVRNVNIRNMTLKNSTGVALEFTDARDIHFEQVTILSCEVGTSLTNVSHATTDFILIVGSNSDNCRITNAGVLVFSGFAVAGGGGHGFKLNNLKTAPFSFCSSTANVGDGINCIDIQDALFKMQISGNGESGIEFVSGCNNNFLNDSIIRNNLSDGIKLTATSDSNQIGSAVNIIGNGGYGVNIVASTCDNNKVDAYFAGNASGTIQDLGTGTLIVSTGLFTTIASDTLKNSADTVNADMPNTTYTLTKSFTSYLGGVIRVKFDMLSTSGGGNNAYGRIYVNGVAVGTEHVNATTSYVTYSDDITVRPFDTVALYVKDSANGGVTTRNLRVYYDKVASPDTLILVD